MIELAEQNTTTVQYLEGTTVTSSTVTNYLYVREVTLDFDTGAIYATIDRGTVTSGKFGENYPEVEITVNPDGTFISSDGKWSGSLGSQAAALVAQLATTFDNFVLASGAVAGTVVANA